MEILKCSLTDCKRIRIKAEQMTLKELDIQNRICEKCGNSLLKETDIANETYKKVSNLYAQKYMLSVCRS